MRAVYHSVAVFGWPAAWPGDPSEAEVPADFGRVVVSQADELVFVDSAISQAHADAVAVGIARRWAERRRQPQA
jgi:hypothetical protein